MNAWFKRFAGSTAVVATVFVVTAPARAKPSPLPSIPSQPYAWWPPNYCSKGAGSWGNTFDSKHGGNRFDRTFL